MGFSRKEYWSGLPCPPSGDLPNTRLGLPTWVSYIAGRFFTNQATSAHSVQLSSVAQSSLTLWDPMDCSKLPCPSPMAQTHVYLVGDAIQPSHPLLFSSPPAFNLSQHQGLFQWVSSLHQVAKVLISSCIVSGCFYITIAELSHCNEDHKASVLTIWLYRKSLPTPDLNNMVVNMLLY